MYCLYETSLTIVLPAFNEEKNLTAMVEDAIGSVSALGIPWEVIVVDDGSTDFTAAICEAFSREYFPKFKFVRHDINRGYGAALQSGFKSATKELVFFTDADRQFRFDRLPDFIRSINGNDMVIGYRRKRMDPWFRKLNSKVGNLLARVMLGVDARDINCAYKLFRTEILQRLPLKSEGALINTEILAFAAARDWKFIEFPVSHFPRKYGQPTGAKFSVIVKTFQEYFELKSRIRFAEESSTGSKTEGID